jgi:hypothetical protein
VDLKTHTIAISVNWCAVLFLELKFLPATSCVWFAENTVFTVNEFGVNRTNFRSQGNMILLVTAESCLLKDTVTRPQGNDKIK